MTAFELLVYSRDVARCVPSSKEGRCLGPPSNGELRRWLRAGAVLINGRRPGPGGEVSFPITELVYFPDNKSQRTTVVQA